MMQVISIVLTNSVYAISGGGAIEVGVRDCDTEPRGVALTLRDNGVGIGPEDLPRLFDAFFTAHATVGTGIGLFVAKQFVEEHGGRITIESSRDEKEYGATVRAFLPLITTYSGS
jgi:signal transduction histidine kinase